MTAPPCGDCGGSGWIWVGPTPALWGGVIGMTWAACASCNDDGSKPKPRRPAVATVPDAARN